MRRKFLLVLCIAFAVFAIYACNGKNGKDGKDNTGSDVEMDTAGCLTCHGMKTDGDNSPQSLMTGSKHLWPASKDGGWYPGSEAECARCHQPDLDSSLINPDAVSGLSCKSCHEMDGSVRNNPIHKSYAVTSDNCIKCHEGIEKYHNTGQGGSNDETFPYIDNISAVYGKLGENFSAHGNESGKAMDAKTGEAQSCSMCHSGVVNANVMEKSDPRKVDNITDDSGVVIKYSTSGGVTYDDYIHFNEKYAPTAKKLHLQMPGSDTISCDTCHNQHSLTLRTKDVTKNIDNQSQVVASAEFMLCTTCHQVNLDFDPTSGVGTLSKKYITTDDVIVPDNGSRYIFGQKDWHGNHDIKYAAHHFANHSDQFDVDAPNHSDRTIVDTHFAGQIYKKYNFTDNGSVLVGKKDVDAGPVTIKGYGINPASATACSNCHDPHGSSKFAEADNTGKDAVKALAYQKVAESWGSVRLASRTSHADSLSYTQSVNCIPCHQSRAFAYAVRGEQFDKYKERIPVGDNSSKQYQIACLTCHVGSTTHFDKSFSGKNEPANLVTAENAKDLRVITNPIAFKNSFHYTMSQADFDKIKAEYPANSIMLCAGCHAGGHGGGTVDEAYIAISASTPNMIVNSGHGSNFGVLTGNIFDVTTNLGSHTPYVVGPLANHKPLVGQYGCTMCHVADKDNHGFAVFDNDSYDTTSLTLINKNLDCTKSCHVDIPGKGNAGNVLGNDVITYKKEVKALQDMLSGIKGDGGIDYEGKTILTSTSMGSLSVDQQKQIGVALGNLMAFAVDPGAFAHMNKDFIKQFVCDNIVPIASYINIGSFTTDNCKDLDLHNIRTLMDGNVPGSQISANTPDNVSLVKDLFHNFTR